MKVSSKTVLAAVLCGAALAVLPWLFPTGPDAGLDAAQFLASGQFFIGAGVVFAGGLLTALTPCVYPLIPITVSIFGARKAESRGRSMMLTSAYVVGMGVIFSLLGIVAAKTGQAFGSVLGSPWVVTGLAVFLLVLASSMFGAFELSLPSSWAGKLNNVGGSGLAGAFLMGSVSGFLAAPCTGPVLTGLLAFVAKTQSTVLGGSLLFVYALGIGVPFFLIGVFTIRLPKGGVWMEWVKSVLGIVLVALAMSYLKDAMPALRDFISGVAEALGKMPGVGIAAVLTAVGVLLGAVHFSFKEGARQVVPKAVGVALVVVAILLRAGALNAGSQGELWVRLGWIKAEEKPALTWHLTFVPTGQQSALVGFDEQLATARASGKPVMIDFGAEWCAACKELERETYVAPQVVREASRFVNIKIDATNQDDSIDKLYERFGIQGLPTVAFISSNGEILNDPRVTGFIEPGRFVAELRKVR